MRETQSGQGTSGATAVTVEARPERRLIPRQNAARHIDFVVRASQKSREEQRRAPLTLALVLDRSGSMSGDKIITAKRAALAVLDQLDERDTVSVVVFDEIITTIQAAARLTPAIKERVRAELDGVNARGSTALHEGWLTGCDSITSHAAEANGLARCFLLTDGQANVGIVDAEQIATQAAGIRRNALLGVSTFGIGDDYAEELLGSMAEAGGGQFHNLRTSAEIATAFAGELGELLLTVAANLRLEFEAQPGASVEMVSVYRAEVDAATPYRWSVMVGDLINGEERHILARVNFPDAADGEGQTARVRAVWVDNGRERVTEWQTLGFSYASDADCEAETPDAGVVHQVGQSISDRAQREALAHMKRGDITGAGAWLAGARATVARSMVYAPTLAVEAEAIEQLSQDIASGPLPSAMSKEAYYQKQLRSRGQRDHRK